MGGVGDVAGELPIILKQKGIEIEIVTPWYGRTKIGEREVESLGKHGIVEFHGRREIVEFVRTDLRDVPVNFIRNSTYFETDYSKRGYSQSRPFPNDHLFRKDYSTPYVESDAIAFYDDALRFSFFSEACLGFIESKNPDIVHINDWVLGYLFGRMAIRGMKQKRVLTIHNIGYQGTIGEVSIVGWNMERLRKDRKIGLLFVDPHPDWNSVNSLRLAMELAERTNTVSPNYMQEMIQPEDKKRYFEGGKGLHLVAGRRTTKRRPLPEQYFIISDLSVFYLDLIYLICID